MDYSGVDDVTISVKFSYTDSFDAFYYDLYDIIIISMTISWISVQNDKR